ncbi:MAG: hypothetical protein SFW35_02805 [Chitinophagales bacterium]|nr:hypothetical protein [Chitinophagales bacterium]
MKKYFVLFSLFFFSITTFAQNEIPLDNKRFSANWFDDLEKAKQSPDQVYYLDLSLRKLKEFPKEIFTFKNLKELYISYNYWPTIPEGLGKLTQLEILDLSGNYYLNTLPNDLAELNKHLKSLTIKDNKLKAGEIEKLKKALPQVNLVY